MAKHVEVITNANAASFSGSGLVNTEVILRGNNLNISFLGGSNDTVLNEGTGNTVGSWFSTSLTVNDLGTALRLAVAGATNMTVEGWWRDPTATAVFDKWGPTSLTSDGHGGTLATGIQGVGGFFTGSIDFTHADPSMSQFSITRTFL